MPFPPLRIRAGSRAIAGFALGVGLLALPAGCETFSVDRPLPTVPGDTTARATAPVVAISPPGKHAVRRGAYVFYSDFELDKADPLFADLEALPDRLSTELRLPPGNAIIQVFLFDTQARYERYMFDEERGRYKHLPVRRAYFITEPRIGGGDELKVFTWMGDHLWTDLRHELTHALLHGVLKDVPLWLDEGLAGFFELPTNNDGVNPQHLDTLRRGPFQPDLARLERLEKVGQMEKPEYREAWAWVHLMLRSDPATRKVLHDYLQALRTNPKPGPLMPKLRDALPDPDQSLADHLATIQFPRPRRK